MNYPCGCMYDLHAFCLSPSIMRHAACSTTIAYQAICVKYPRRESNPGRWLKRPLLKTTQLREQKLFEVCRLNASQAQIVCCFFEKLWVVEYGYLYIA